MTNDSPQDAPSKSSLLVIFLTVFIDLLGFAIVLPLLPIYADQFTLDKTGWQLGLLMASFSAMQFVFAPMWGRLSDRIGRRPVLMIGLGGSVVFYTLFGVATIFGSLGLLFLSRIGAGIAGATISTAQAYIADTTSLAERPKGMALIGMAFGLGFTLGPLVGFLAVLGEQDAPLPWPGFVAAGLSAIALLLAVFKLPESLKEGREKAAKRILDFHAFRLALSTPSVAFVLIAIFVCVFSFANFETTLSLLIKGSDRFESVFDFSSWQVCLTYAYIGLTLALVQGGIVRRLAGRVSEGTLATTGALLEVIGFGLMIAAIHSNSVALLMFALAVVVTGFSLMQPSLNSLLSRRSDPRKQGAILGVGQSMNSLARIIGAGIGIPLLRHQLEMPYYVAAGMMFLGMLLLVIASRAGRDYAAQAE